MTAWYAPHRPGTQAASTRSGGSTRRTKDASITEQDILDHCRKNLTGYKRPKIVEFRDELPKTNVGKILRRALRDG